MIKRIVGHHLTVILEYFDDQERLYQMMEREGYGKEMADFLIEFFKELSEKKFWVKVVIERPDFICRQGSRLSVKCKECYDKKESDKKYHDVLIETYPYREIYLQNIHLRELFWAELFEVKTEIPITSTNLMEKIKKTKEKLKELSEEEGEGSLVFSSWPVIYNVCEEYPSLSKYFPRAGKLLESQLYKELALSTDVTSVKKKYPFLFRNQQNHLRWCQEVLRHI